MAGNLSASLASKKPNNIIMVIGDGMGPAYTTAFRYFNDDPNTTEVEKTVFDRHLVGLSSTYPATISGYVTDSAAGATALASGIKTYNGAIGVDLTKQAVNTVLAFAKQAGKKTGVVVTSHVNHATPASFLTHNADRNNYNAIADSLIDNNTAATPHFDLLFGGGWKYFLRADRDLVNGFKQAGFQYIDSYSQLQSLQMGIPALGLFAEVGLPWALDDSEPLRLSMMTQSAIEQLENESGFFMLIEASQIDWAGHDNDITAAMGEMRDLAKTLEYLEVYVQNHPDTLVVVTADHSTGGLTLGANDKYEWQPQILRTMRHTPAYIAKLINRSEPSIEQLNDLLGFALTADEFAKLLEIEKLSLQGSIENVELVDDKKLIEREKAYYASLNEIIDTKTNTGWTTGAHTAVDVPVLAFGAQHELFIGHNDNTDIAKKVFTLLEK
jgi:alkaline phosphatase